MTLKHKVCILYTLITKSNIRPAHFFFLCDHQVFTTSCVMNKTLQWSTEVEIILAQKLQIYQEQLCLVESTTKRQQSLYTILTVVCLFIAPIPGCIAAIEIVTDDNPNVLAAILTAVCSLLTSFIISLLKFYKFEEKIRMSANNEIRTRDAIEYLSDQLALPLSIRDSAYLVLRRFYKTNCDMPQQRRIDITKSDDATKVSQGPDCVCGIHPRLEYELSRMGIDQISE